MTTLNHQEVCLALALRAMGMTHTLHRHPRTQSQATAGITPESVSESEVLSALRSLAVPPLTHTPGLLCRGSQQQ
jgi:hypothetical protein